MPAAAAPTREEIRRLIGALGAGGHYVLALEGGQGAGVNQGAGVKKGGKAPGAGALVVNLSKMADVDAVFELLALARKWSRQDGEDQPRRRLEEALVAKADALPREGPCDCDDERAHNDYRAAG